MNLSNFPAKPLFSAFVSRFPAYTLKMYTQINYAMRNAGNQKGCHPKISFAIFALDRVVPGIESIMRSVESHIDHVRVGDGTCDLLHGRVVHKVVLS